MAETNPNKFGGLLLFGGLAATAFLMLNSGNPAAAAPSGWTDVSTGATTTDSNPTTTPATDVTSGWGGTDSMAPTTAPTTAPATAPASTSSPVAVATRPGYALDGEPDIVFASAAVRANANNPGQILDTQYGDGSRNLRLNMLRTLGSQYHVFVEDIYAGIIYRWNQGGFGSWDDMYWSFVNDPGSFAAVLSAYNQYNTSQAIRPRW